jgi:hypothetical protein
MSQHPGTQQAYRDYLARWDELGQFEVGAFVKFAGRLIKKMSEEEFAPVHQEYEGLARRYLESIARGDTVNDVVVRLLRDRAATLVRSAPTEAKLDLKP